MSDPEHGRQNPILDILYAEDTGAEWLIPDMLPQGTLVCMAGDSNVGKSYLGYLLAMALSTGLPTIGDLQLTGVARRVLYFDDENSPLDRNKYLRRIWAGLKAQRGGIEPDVDRLVENFWPVHYELGGDDWAEVAAGWIDDIKPAVVMYDTANSTFGIKKEEDNGEASQCIRQLRELMHRTDPVHTVYVMKHSKIGKDAAGRRTMRGAKSWRNFADGVIFHVKGAGRPKKSGLHLSRLERDKVRAYGLTSTVYITPEWTDEDKTGLILDCSQRASPEHARSERKEFTGENG